MKRNFCSSSMSETNVVNEICRLCGTENGILINIFESSPNNECIEKIEAVVPDVVILREDSLSKFICHRCVAKVKDFYDFKGACIRTQKVLKNKLPWMSSGHKTAPLRAVSPTIKFIGGPLAYPFGQQEPEVEVLTLSDDEDVETTAPLNADQPSSGHLQPQVVRSLEINGPSPVLPEDPRTQSSLAYINQSTESVWNGNIPPGMSSQNSVVHSGTARMGSGRKNMPSHAFQSLLQFDNQVTVKQPGYHYYPETALEHCTLPPAKRTCRQSQFGSQKKSESDNLSVTSRLLATSSTSSPVSTPSCILTTPSSVATSPIISRPSSMATSSNMSRPSSLATSSTIARPSSVATSSTMARPSFVATSSIITRPSSLATSSTVPRPSLVATSSTMARPSFVATSSIVTRPSSLATSSTVPRPSFVATSSTKSRPSSVRTTPTTSRPSYVGTPSNMSGSSTMARPCSTSESLVQTANAVSTPRPNENAFVPDGVNNNITDNRHSSCMLASGDTVCDIPAQPSKPKPKPKSKKKPVELTEADVLNIRSKYPTIETVKICGNTIIFTCTLCNKMLLTEEAICNHECLSSEVTEAKDRSSPCDCDCSSYVELSSDDEMSNDTERHMCTICGRLFHSATRLQKHLETHP